MIITIFGDVHGNLIALEELFAIEKSETDLFIAHGDIVNYGPWSNECVAYLDQINNLQLLKGNHENYFLNGCYDGKNEVAQAFFGYCYERYDKALNPILENYKQFFKVDNFKIQHTIFDKYIFEKLLESVNSKKSSYVIFLKMIVSLIEFRFEERKIVLKLYLFLNGY